MPRGRARQEVAEDRIEDCSHPLEVCEIHEQRRIGRELRQERPQRRLVMTGEAAEHSDPAMRAAEILHGKPEAEVTMELLESNLGTLRRQGLARESMNRRETGVVRVAGSWAPGLESLGLGGRISPHFSEKTDSITSDETSGWLESANEHVLDGASIGSSALETD